MNIIPWRRRDLQPVGFTDDLWSRLFRGGEFDLTSRLPEVFRSPGYPAVNLAETEDRFRITMDCPGMEEQDFSIEAMGSQLVISGERRWEDEQDEKDFRRIESQFGRFTRTVELPSDARTTDGAVEAHYRKGVLTIDVPKVEKTPAARIKVQAG